MFRPRGSRSRKALSVRQPTVSRFFPDHRINNARRVSAVVRTPPEAAQMRRASPTSRANINCAMRGMLPLKHVDLVLPCQT